MNKSLIIKNDGIGDLILSSGIISGLSEKLGGSSVLLTCIENKEVAEAIPNLSDVIYVSRDDLSLGKLGREWQERLLLTRTDRVAKEQLESYQFESAIVLRRFIRRSTFRIMSWTRAKKRLSFWQFPTNIAIAEAQPVIDDWNNFANPRWPQWESDYYKTAISESLGISVGTAPSLTWQNELASKTERRSEHEIALIVSGSSSRWPDDHWLRLASLLLIEGFRIVAFGGPESAKLLAKLRATSPSIQIFPHRKGLRSSFIELSKFQVAIGNDTGLSHLASMVVGKLHVIQGGGTIGRFFSPGETPNLVLSVQPLPCFDCGWKCIFTSGRRCLDSIQPESIVEKIKGQRDLRSRAEANGSPFLTGWRRASKENALPAWVSETGEVNLL